MVELSSVKVQLINQICSAGPNYWQIQALREASLKIYAPSGLIAFRREISDDKPRSAYLSDYFVITLLLCSFLSIRSGLYPASRIAGSMPFSYDSSICLSNHIATKACAESIFLERSAAT